MVCVPVSILGGLPAVADITFGYDGFTGEHYSEVQELYWRTKASYTHPHKHGKALSRKLWDKALAYDPYFANLIEEANTWFVLYRNGDD